MFEQKVVFIMFTFLQFVSKKLFLLQFSQRRCHVKFRLTARYLNFHDVSFSFVSVAEHFHLVIMQFDEDSVGKQ